MMRKPLAPVRRPAYAYSSRSKVVRMRTRVRLPEAMMRRVAEAREQGVPHPWMASVEGAASLDDAVELVGEGLTVRRPVALPVLFACRHHGPIFVWSPVIRPVVMSSMVVRGGVWGVGRWREIG